MVAFILKESEKQALQKALRAQKVGPPPPESYIVRRDELPLDFDSKQLIRMQLLEIESYLKLNS